MNKKNLRYAGRAPKIVSIDDSDDEPIVSQRLLQSIQQKLERSAALNGGFDKLLYKIDAIENTQIDIGNKVDKIHDAIYDPDTGLFSRIATNKTEHQESVSEVEKKVVELTVWKDQQKKDSEHSEELDQKFDKKINDIEHSIESLNRFKQATVGIAKWLGAAAGGGIITIVFKVLYDFVILK